MRAMAWACELELLACRPRPRSTFHCMTRTDCPCSTRAPASDGVLAESSNAPSTPRENQVRLTTVVSQSRLIAGKIDQTQPSFSPPQSETELDAEVEQISGGKVTKNS